MSTINATIYQHESGTGNNITLDKDGNVACAALVKVGTYTNVADGNPGTQLSPAGGVNVIRDTANSTSMFAGYVGSDEKFKVDATGSIRTAGNIVTEATTASCQFYRATTSAAHPLLVTYSDIGAVRRSQHNLLANGEAQKRSGAGQWTGISDVRAKNTILDYSTGLSELIKLRPVTYKFNSDDITRVGLIAQEVETVMPETVKIQPGEIDGVEVSDRRIFDPTPIQYALINAVKEMSSRIEALEAKLAALSGPSTTDIQDN